MAVERVDYSSDDEYQQALQQESLYEQEMWEREQEKYGKDYIPPEKQRIPIDDEIPF